MSNKLPVALGVILSSIVSQLRAQAIYGEILGNSLGYYTINYEHLLNDRGKNVWLIHGGIGIYRVLDTYTHKAFPIGLTYFRKKQSNHHKETGICLTYIEGFADNRHTWIGERVQYSKALMMLLNVGYRYEKPNGRFIFKVYYSPTIRIEEFADPPYSFPKRTFYPLNAGLSIGYKLSHRL